MSQPKILIIDDERELVLLTAKWLEVWGYEVFCYYEGLGACDAIRRLKPDLILLDIRLPDVSGFEIFQTIRSDEQLKELPVLFFSTLSEAEIKKMIGQEIADGFVKKPYEPADLESLIKQVLTKKEKKA